MVDHIGGIKAFFAGRIVKAIQYDVSFVPWGFTGGFSWLEAALGDFVVAMGGFLKSSCGSGHNPKIPPRPIAQILLVTR